MLLFGQNYISRFINSPRANCTNWTNIISAQSTLRRLNRWEPYQLRHTNAVNTIMCQHITKHFKNYSSNIIILFPESFHSTKPQCTVLRILSCSVNVDYIRLYIQLIAILYTLAHTAQYMNDFFRSTESFQQMIKNWETNNHFKCAWNSLYIYYIYLQKFQFLYNFKNK